MYAFYHELKEYSVENESVDFYKFINDIASIG